MKLFFWNRLICFAICLLLLRGVCVGEEIQGTLWYTGTVSGIALVSAVTNLEVEGDIDYEWEMELDGPFTNAYILTNVPPGIFYLVGTLETSETVDATTPWGHYADWRDAPQTVTVGVGQTVANIDIPMIDGVISNNPYTDDSCQCTGLPKVCDGTLATCLVPGQGWLFEGIRVDEEYFFDVSVVCLSNGFFRLYGNARSQPQGGNDAFESYVSSNGIAFTLEPGYRFEEFGCFMPNVVILSNYFFRCYYTDQSVRPNDADGGRAIKSALSTNGGLDFVTEGDCLICDTNLPNEFGGIRGAKVLVLTNGTYRMYYHGADTNNIRKVLSAHSTDGLLWTRDAGVRIDPPDYCPPAQSIGNMAPYIPFASNEVHLYVAMSRCDEEYACKEAGIFDCPSTNGLDFVVPDHPVALDYYIEQSYSNQPTDPQVMSQDPAVVFTPEGTRMYFGVYNGADVLTNVSGIYSLLLPDFDGDQVPDWSEIVAGTDPMDDQSYLGFVSSDVQPVDHAVVLQWSSVTGRQYAVERMQHLESGTLQVLATNILATPTVNSYTDTTASGEAHFYRIKVD